MTQEQESILPSENNQKLPQQTPEEALFSYTQRSLGFVETDQMQVIRQQISGIDKEAEGSEEEFRRYIIGYQDLAAREIDRIQDQDLYPKAQIGLTVASAAIYHSFGNTQKYREALDDAITYADNMGYKDVTRDLRERRLEIFKEDFRRGFNELIDLLEIVPEGPLPPDPDSMGVDHRTFEDLTKQERQEAQRVIYQELGLQPDKLNQAKIRDYTTQADETARVPGEIKISVFRTNRESQGIFLQELTYMDAQKRWVIGPDSNI